MERSISESIKYEKNRHKMSVFFINWGYRGERLRGLLERIPRTPKNFSEGICKEQTIFER